MKILVFGEEYFNYTSSAVYALKSLGHEVKVIYMPLLHKSDLSIWEHIRYKLKDQDFINSFYGKCKKEIVETINSFQPDVLLSINGNAYYEFIDKSILNKVKKIGAKSVSWYMDTIKRFEHIEQNLKKFDYIYSFEPNDTEWTKEKYGVTVKYLPIGVAEELYCNNKEDVQEIYDISFVGNSTDNRLEVLNKIAEYCDANNKKMIVYGHYWHNKHWWQKASAKKKFSKKYPHLVKYIKNEFLYGENVAKLYLQSKICLNIHISLHKGINPRTFEILGNGNFELCDYRSDAEQFGLIDKENISMFSDAEECVKQVNYYLNNEAERKTIGKRGKETVENKYTMTKLLSDVLEEMKGR